MELKTVHKIKECYLLVSNTS